MAAIGAMIGRVAESNASGRGTIRSLGTGVPFRTIGRQQSGVVELISVCCGARPSNPTAQHGLFGTQQKGATGSPVVRTTIATARTHATRLFAPGRRLTLADMPRG